MYTSVVSVVVAISLAAACLGCERRPGQESRGPTPTPTVDTGVDDEEWRIFEQTSRALSEARDHYKGQPRDTERYVNHTWVETDASPQGSLHLGSLIGHSASSSIFTASLEYDDVNGTTHRRPVVVKHANTCRELMVRGRNARSLLVIEAIFMHVLAPLKLAPAPIYLSPPTLLTSMSGLPARLQSPFLLEHPRECIARGAETRFLIEERAGVDLFTYFDYFHTTTDWAGMARRAVTLGIRLVQMLESLHRLGIVHGDIHGGNVLFRAPVGSPDEILPDDMDLLFVDFEFAIFYPSSMGAPVRESSHHRDLSPIWLSPWQLLHYRIGRRDDVYRAIDWVADALSMAERYNHLTADIDLARLRGMTDSDLAAFKDVRTMFSSLGPLAGPAMEAELRHIAGSHLGSYAHPDDRPEYDEIVAHLQTVVRLLS